MKHLIEIFFNRFLELDQYAIGLVLKIRFELKTFFFHSETVKKTVFLIKKKKIFLRGEKNSSLRLFR